MATDPQYWTVAEIADVLRTSKMTVYRLIHNGTLDAHQIGRTFRIPDAALTTYQKTIPYTPTSDNTPANSNGHTDQHTSTQTQEGGTSDGS